MRGAQPAVAQAPETTRRFRLRSPATALLAGGAVLALMIADVPLSRLAHQSLNANGGSLPVWFSAAYGVVGFVVAWRKPGNPLGWIILGAAAFGALSEGASYYTVADYRLHHGGLPLGWVALLAQPGWAPTIALGGLAVLLFPDGRPPSPRWRWVLWAYIAAGLLWVGGALALSVGAIAGHHVQVDSSGNIGGPAASAAWWDAVSVVFFALLIVCWLGSLVGQVISYRRSSGERRQQLKWLAGGVGAVLASLAIRVAFSGTHGFLSVVGSLGAAAGLLALPVCMGVAIFRYRLFDIDRVISRTLSYAIVTGLLVGVYAGIVLLVTEVMSITSTVAVAGATLAAAALFNPLRRRVQRLVDRRFNRARYDADRMVAAFAARLKDAMDPDDARAELVDTVHRSLEPAHVSVWIRQSE